jgi:hypothetical protein
MRSETERPFRFASAASCRCSARVTRTLSNTDWRSAAGIGGLPRFVFIGDNVLHLIVRVNMFHFPPARIHSTTSGQAKRRYRPIRRTGRGFPPYFPRVRLFSYTQDTPTLSRFASSSGVRMSSGFSVCAAFICNDLTTPPESLNSKGRKPDKRSAQPLFTRIELCAIVRRCARTVIRHRCPMRHKIEVLYFH